MKHFNIILFLLSSLFLSLTGCQSLEDINTNKQGVTVEMSARDGVAIGGKIQTLQTCVIPAGTLADGTNVVNKYQVAYHIGPDTWSGYFGQNADWNSGNNFTTFFMVPWWLGSPFNASYTDAFAPWLAIKNHPSTKEHPENFALAQILKVSTWHKATDYYGPIPYLQAGEGLYVTPYDSQEVVYRTMLDELDKSVEALFGFYQQGGVTLFSGFDLLYGGSVVKWIKYANSLMLRLAMRTRAVDMALAKKYVAKAVNHPVGVMTELDDQAKINSALGLDFINNIETCAVQYNETRMGVPIFSYLAGYEDPRLPKYFKASKHPDATTVGKDKFMPFPTGWGRAYKGDNPEEDKESFALTSLPNIEKNTPIYWLRTSEVLFLKAEGALFGMVEGNAADYYRQGIEMSFEENGISKSQVGAYLSSGKTPIPVTIASPKVSLDHTFAMKSKATTAFTGSINEMLEKIITQKWIALYPNGMEAWTEWRRTGYPYICPPITNRSNGITTDENQVRRMQYPINNARTKEDQDAYDAALQLLGGLDNQATKLWWDKK